MINIKQFIISIFVGFGVGIITVIGQKYLPIQFNFLANSGAIWLIPAYLLSCYFNTNFISSIFVSILCLIACVFGYYSFEPILNNHAFVINIHVIIWLICALIGGFIFGLGAYYSHSKNPIFSQLSKNLLPAVFFSEGVNKLIHLKDYNHMIPSVIMVTVIGVLLYFVIHRKNAFEKNSILTFAILASLGTLFYEILYRLV